MYFKLVCKYLVCQVVNRLRKVAAEQSTTFRLRRFSNIINKYAH